MNKGNRGTPWVFRVAVCLLCAIVVTANLMGDGLYARYSATASGSGSAKVAKFDFGISYEFSGFTTSTTIGEDCGDVYVIVDEFWVTNTGEVTYTYDLTVALSQDSTTIERAPSYDNPYLPSGYSLDAPAYSGTLYNIYNTEGSSSATIASTSASALTDGAFTALEQGKAYYARLENGQYAWYSAELTDSYYLKCANELELGFGETQYYKIIYFIRAKPGVSFEQVMNLFYKAECTQVN